jgi:malate dehydrogenase
MKSKVSIVGAGMVGSTVAQRLAEMEICDIILVDIVEGMPQGKALDLLEASPLVGYDVDIVGTNEYETIEDSDIVVVCAGVPRKPGMSREDLASINASIMGSICNEVKKYANDSIVIVVTNPLDAMVYVANKNLSFERERVIGMGGLLDSSRFAYFVASELKCSVRDVQALVLGGHGTHMLPLPRYTTVRGVCIEKLLPPATIKTLVKRTINAGAEIVSLLKSGSAFYAPSAAVA